jgi:crossover junction endodeoxyribonuclease RuvC
MIVLGIDPGSRRIGFGVVEESAGKIKYLAGGLLKITAHTDEVALLETKRGIESLIRQWQPELVAIERLFFVKNRTTGMAVAQARGVVIGACAEAGLRIVEFTPNEIKAGITGHGGADKRAVTKMVSLILNRPDLSLIDDAMDALGVALFACQQERWKGRVNTSK